jgi:hypothetical protein
MTGIYVTLLFVCIVAVFWGIDYWRRKNHVSTEEPHEETDECCGAHEVCEKDNPLNSKHEIEYYDDEELDVFAGRSGDSYDEEEIRQFCDVFYTLKEYDVAGWLKSLRSRNIELPENLREEALLIVRERRGL